MSDITGTAMSDSIKSCNDCEFSCFAEQLLPGLSMDDEKCVFIRGEVLREFGEEVSCGVAGAAIIYLAGKDTRFTTGVTDA